MSKNIYITISGGVVQSVNTDFPVQEVIVIDLDADDQETVEQNSVSAHEAAQLKEVY